MMPEFFHRIRKDLLITFEGLRETVLAIAERVTRKVQILSLHRHAAATYDQMKLIHQEVGQQVAAIPLREPFPLESLTSHEASDDMVALEQRVADGARRIQVLTHDLERTGALISELEMETLREEFLTLQRDLAIRAATLERLTLPRGSVAIGQLVRDLNLPSAVRLMAVFRGPTLLLSFEHLRFRAGDVVLLLGQRADLKEATPCFLTRRSATA